jgi:hypothetical protein
MASIEKIRSAGFVPTSSFEQGLETTIRFFTAK